MIIIEKLVGMQTWLPLPNDNYKTRWINLFEGLEKQIKGK